MPVRQTRDNTRDAFRSIVLYMGHIGRHHVCTVSRADLKQRLPSGFIGCDLGLKIRHVVINIPARIFTRPK